MPFRLDDILVFALVDMVGCNPTDRVGRLDSRRKEVILRDHR